MSARTPKDFLLAGQELLASVLEPAGFRFVFRDEGNGSGGQFSRGEFCRGDRRIELHYRWSLGLVAYHCGQHRASHDWYMRELGAWERCDFPGFSAEPLQAFRDLAHDLQFATDFTTGDASLAISAARREAEWESHRSRSEMAQAVGDAQLIEKMHKLFRENSHSEVIRLFNDLRYPERLSPAQIRLVELARNRAAS